MTVNGEEWWKQVLCGSQGALRAPDSDENYVVLPRVSDPRVVVDTASQRAMRDATQRFIENRAGAAAGVLSEGVSRVLARPRRAEWTVASPEPTLRQHLSELLGADVRLSVAVGPPRPNRKPIVRCYEGSTLRAVAKMGPDPHTAQMVINEGDWLERFAENPFTEFMTPEVLHRGAFGSSELLVIAPFDVQGASSVGVDAISLELTRVLTGVSSITDPVVSASWWTTLQSRLAAPGFERFAEVAAELATDERFQSLDSSMWHGDWSPWNIGRLQDQRLMVWDWERATDGVPLGLDLLHLHYQYGEGIDAASVDLERLGVSAANHRVIKAAYFLELVARHYEGGSMDSDRQRDVEAQLTALWASGGAR